MKSIKFSKINLNSEDVLEREQLKKILGGDDGYDTPCYRCLCINGQTLFTTAEDACPTFCGTHGGSPVHSNVRVASALCNN